MGDIKASGTVALRKILKAKGKEVEKAFLSHLSVDDQKRFQSVLHISKIPIELETKFIKIGSAILYPNLPQQQALWQFGHASVDEDLNAAFKIFLRFLNPETVCKQTAKLWCSLHSQGKAYSVKDGESGLIFYLEEYPDMPVAFLFGLEGYLVRLMELTGIKQIISKPDLTNNNQWSIKLNWIK